MPRQVRPLARRRFPAFTCVLVGLVGALGFVGVSVAASISTLDAPAQIGAGAAAVRFDPPPPPPLTFPTAHQLALDGMFAAISDVRAAAGLRQLEWNDLVTLAAQQHSDDMAARRTMSHTGSDGSNAGDRLSRVGFAWSWWGENIAAGFTDPGAVVRAWMASPGHRAHLLGDFQYLGVGIATSDMGIQYWTLDLAR